MTNPPGDEPTQPDQPHEPGPDQPSTGRPQPDQPSAGQSQPGYQPGYWEQQAQQQAQQQAYPPPGQPPSGYPPQAPIQYAPDHPQATTSLVLGILGLVLCQVLAPFAWVMGKRTLDEIDASQGQVGGRGAAQAGYVLGIIGSVILGLSLVVLAIVLVFYVILAVGVLGGNVASN